MLKNFKINEDWFLLPKFLFFFVYAALASHSPFIALFFQWKGLSKSLIGILLCLYILMGYTATQVWSIMADRFDKHKIFFAFIVFMSGLLNIILYFANSTVPLFIFALALACVELPIFSFLDTHVLSILETANSKQTGSIIKDYKIYFGRNRLWAAISWGIIAFISGLFIEYYGYFSMVILTNSFYFISFFGIYLLPKRLYKKDKNSVEIDVDDTPPNEVVKESSNENLLNKEPSNTINELSFWRKILLIFTPQTICIMIPVLLVGVGLAIVLNFLNLFLQDLQASKTLIGIAVAVSTVMELPFFFYSEKMVEKLHVEGMIILSLIAFIIRFFAYTILTNPWWVLPIELLHGIAYSAIWAGVVYYASNIAPRGLEATTQSIFLGIFGGLGGVIGTLLGGFFYDKYGSIAMFQIFGMSFILVLIFFICSSFYFWFQKRRKREHTLLTKEVQ